MNGIVPQGIMARNECQQLSRFSKWLISSQFQAPYCGAFQDGLIGLSEFTKNGILFNKWHAMSMLCDVIYANNYNFNNVNVKLMTSGVTGMVNFDEPMYTNREIVSRLLPEINIIKKKPTIYSESYAGLLKYDPSDIEVNIVRGELKSGILDKSTCGQDTPNSIFHIIANEYGNDKALDSIYDFQQLANKFLLYHGFTIGISDINISQDAMRKIKLQLEKMILESRRITESLNNGKLIAPIGIKTYDYHESEQINVLERGDDFVNPIFNDIDINSNMMARLILTGTKGKLPNFIDINGALGTLTINGQRFGPQAGWGRTSPYFARFDTEPAANGFISTSYREGITNDVYPFMAGQARDGLISNALKTSVTGHQNRISIKNLESVIVDNLRKSSKGSNMIQPLYNECGLDPSKTELVDFPTVMLSNSDFDKYHVNISQVNPLFRNKDVQKLLDEEFKQLTADRNEYRSIHMKLEDHNPKEYVLSNKKQLPINLSRIIDDTVYNYSSVVDEMKSKDKILDPVKAITLVKKTCSNLGYAFYNDIYQNKNRPIPKYISTITEIIQIYIRSHLCMNNLLKKNVLNCHLDIIIQRINITYKKALVDYGTSAGILAAQCASEPMTQYLLNSKHRAGGQGGTKTNAIERIREILGARPTSNMINPHMMVIVKEEYESDKLKIQEIANHIEMMTLSRFVDNTKIFFEDFGKPTHPDFISETKVIETIIKHNHGQKIPGNLTRWCIRFGIDREELILKSMKLETIILAIRINYPELFVVYTPENYHSLFIRCYIKNIGKQTNDYYNVVVLPMMHNITNIIVRGVKDIINTTVIDVLKHHITDTGALEVKKVYAIYTSGSNLKSILGNPYIDPYRTQSDSIEEMEKVFGVVAARNKIMYEMKQTLDLNQLFCTLFADEMTYSGQVSSIQKTGLQKRENANITLRLSFQTPVQVIQEASINGLCDHIQGVSGPLIMGTTPNMGSTFNQICVNEDFIKENTKTLDNLLENL